MSLWLVYYKSWIPKLVYVCYDDTSSFSKHIRKTRDNFLYLIGMIGQKRPYVKILFEHVNVFAIILDTWHIIKILSEINAFI